MQCDIVEMDAYLLLLGQLWKFDTNATYNSKHNCYVSTWKDKKIAILPTSTSHNTSSAGIEGK